MTGWMCPFKREQAWSANRRVGYEMLTHCRLYCGETYALISQIHECEHATLQLTALVAALFSSIISRVALYQATVSAAYVTEHSPDHLSRSVCPQSVLLQNG